MSALASASEDASSGGLCAEVEAVELLNGGGRSHRGAPAVLGCEAQRCSATTGPCVLALGRGGPGLGQACGLVQGESRSSPSRWVGRSGGRRPAAGWRRAVVAGGGM
jgi:hypothetical protein